MKFKIVLIDFPFDEFSGSKLRPALCLTKPISKYNQVVLAVITSNLQNANEITDVIIEKTQIDFGITGLKVSSVIKIHRLLTAADKIIRNIIGDLPEFYHSQVDEKIKKLFDIA